MSFYGGGCSEVNQLTHGCLQPGCPIDMDEVFAMLAPTLLLSDRLDYALMEYVSEGSFKTVCRNILAR